MKTHLDELGPDFVGRIKDFSVLVLAIGIAVAGYAAVTVVIYAVVCVIFAWLSGGCLRNS